MTTINLVTLIDAPADICFDLARDVEAHIASTAGSRERAVAGVTSGLLGAGDQVRWQAEHLGLRWKLTSRITEFDRPRRFVDEQVRGPFRSWWHAHQFQPSDEGTLMIDLVRYQLPLGPVGKLIGKLYLDAYLANLLEQRAQMLKAIAEEPKAPR
jgi:ligand-binding SRPBCC domain-containing protein